MKILSLVVACACLLSCQSQSSSERNSSTSLIASAVQEDISVVAIEKAGITDFNYLIQSNGKVIPAHEQKVTASTSGKVIYCALQNDHLVSSNAILVKLDTRDLDIKLQKARAALFNSNLNYRSDLLSQESLLKGRGQEIIDTVHRKLKSNSGLTDAELDMEAILLEKEKCITKAAFAGNIASVKVNKGMFVNTGDELFTIYSHNSLLLETKILEEDIGLVKIGYQAELYPISSTRKYFGSVVEVNPIVDQNGMVSIKVKISDGLGLLPGMSATTIIQVPHRKTLTVSKQAIVKRGGKSVVFTYREGLAKWNDVVLGKDNGRVVEVKRGLRAGDSVIITNNLQLAHDSPVKIEPSLVASERHTEI